MADTVIRVENLSKRYILNHQQEGQGKYKTLQETMVDGAKSLLTTVNPLARRANLQLSGSREEFWALKDVSFEIKQGDRVGIIGRNGAGKSTLLKILSRIVEPTRGQIEITGRVASLLEVGTGFHPELTGRENIYLNGAILGMGREEIKRKFDEIVAFAEVEKFLDTPVKRYSSGMYVRLAFAVAAHLEPEILIVDEVLAVGDAQFQKKCLGKMEDVAGEGRAIVFVSHQMDAVQRLCNQCIWLDKGTVRRSDDFEATITEYIFGEVSTAKPGEWDDLSQKNRSLGTRNASFSRIKYNASDSAKSKNLHPDGSLDFLLEIKSNANRKVASLAVGIYDNSGFKLINLDILSVGQLIELETGLNTIKFQINSLHLKPDSYRIGLWMSDPMGEVYDWIENAIEISVIEHLNQSLGTKPRTDGCITCNFTVTVLGSQFV